MCFFQFWFGNPRSFVVGPTTPTARAKRLVRCKYALAMLAVFFVDVGSNDCFAQTSEGLTPKPEESSAQVGQIEQEIISEINEIRKSLGGGLSQELGAMNDSLERNSKALSNIIGEAKPEVPIGESTNEATDKTTSADALFGQELTRFVVGEAIEEVVDDSDREQNHEVQSTRDSHARPANLTVSQSPNDALSQQQLLRRCARGLEQLAGELEQVEAYSNADNLRIQAGELWHKARTAR